MKKLLNLILFLTISISGINAENLQHRTDNKAAPMVYFTKDVSSQGLM
nr:hypothetical protein [uncultured Treponema sp.]